MDLKTYLLEEGFDSLGQARNHESTARLVDELKRTLREKFPEEYRELFPNDIDEEEEDERLQFGA